MKMDAPHLHVSAMRLSNDEFDINKIRLNPTNKLKYML